MFQSIKILSFIACFVFVVACGANAFKFMEAGLPEDEKSRVNREQNLDPDQELADAKADLEPALVSALDEYEKIIADGKTPTEDQRNKLKDALTASFDDKVLAQIKNGDVSEASEDIEKLGRVATAYQGTTKYKELDFLGVVLAASSDSASLLAGDCDSGMEYFLDVAGSVRKDYCDGNGLEDMDNLEIAYMIRSVLFTDRLNNGTYEFSKEIDEFSEEDASEEIAYLIGDEVFSSYIQSLFFQVTYVSCFFVTDDCAVDSSRIDENALRRIWESFQLAVPFEGELKEEGLLPAGLGFTAQDVIDDVLEQAETIQTCRFSEKVYCALEQHFKSAGEACQGDEDKVGECAAG